MERFTSRQRFAESRDVLLVDDNPEFRHLTRMLLEHFERCRIVGEAEDGWEAIERARELQPDIVILDVEMPLMDGIEALPRIRAVAPDARVIVYSSEPSSRGRALALGAFRYVEKHMDPMLVAVAVREALLERDGEPVAASLQA